MFGWGIGHEIGHDINQGTYAIAEITNNYFAQLSTRGAEVNSTARFAYQSVYDHVTSGSIGRPGNGKVALAMYWQLHLAYDIIIRPMKIMKNSWQICSMHVWIPIQELLPKHRQVVAK